ncbi:hypothetical protein K438DRAFT_1759334 [Mycena galopus ATCC 62051]|nr:hypothetical protein K438DRAFT_1759334 [Mycena galopus ATCC 62051]
MCKMNEGMSIVVAFHQGTEVTTDMKEEESFICDEKISGAKDEPVNTKTIESGGQQQINKQWPSLHELPGVERVTEGETAKNMDEQGSRKNQKNLTGVRAPEERRIAREIWVKYFQSEESLMNRIRLRRRQQQLRPVKKKLRASFKYSAWRKFETRADLLEQNAA